MPTTPMTLEVKSTIVGLIEKGLSTEDIIAHLHNRYTRQQIAAIRAWVTMGKYGKGVPKAEPINKNRVRISSGNPARHALREYFRSIQNLAAEALKVV